MTIFLKDFLFSSIIFNVLLDVACVCNYHKIAKVIDCNGVVKTVRLDIRTSINMTNDAMVYQCRQFT